MTFLLIMRLKQNVLVDDNGSGVLCDAKFDSVMFGKGEYCGIHSKCWWMPHERLIMDNEADDECALAPPSMPADIYGVALTIMQVGFASQLKCHLLF